MKLLELRILRTSNFVYYFLEKFINCLLYLTKPNWPLYHLTSGTIPLMSVDVAENSVFGLLLVFELDKGNRKWGKGLYDSLYLIQTQVIDQKLSSNIQGLYLKK